MAWVVWQVRLLQKNRKNCENPTKHKRALLVCRAKKKLFISRHKQKNGIIYQQINNGLILFGWSRHEMRRAVKRISFGNSWCLIHSILSQVCHQLPFDLIINSNQTEQSVAHSSVERIYTQRTRIDLSSVGWKQKQNRNTDRITHD